MRLVHIADWHIGRQFHNVSLLKDQVHVFDQLIDVVKSSQTQAVVIAGDVFDRAHIPAIQVEQQVAE